MGEKIASIAREINDWQGSDFPVTAALIDALVETFAWNIGLWEKLEEMVLLRHREIDAMINEDIRPKGATEPKGRSMKLQFNDGVEIDTGGDLRTLELADGLYVVGAGFLIPVGSREEAVQTIKDMTTGEGQ